MNFRKGHNRLDTVISTLLKQYLCITLTPITPHQTLHIADIFTFAPFFSVQKYASSQTALEAEELFCFLPHVFSLATCRTQMPFIAEFYHQSERFLFS